MPSAAVVLNPITCGASVSMMMPLVSARLVVNGRAVLTNLFPTRSVTPGPVLSKLSTVSFSEKSPAATVYVPVSVLP